MSTTDTPTARRFDGFRTPTPAHESPAGLAAHRRTWGERTAHGIGSLAVAVDVGLVLCLAETGHTVALQEHTLHAVSQWFHCFTPYFLKLLLVYLAPR